MRPPGAEGQEGGIHDTQNRLCSTLIEERNLTAVGFSSHRNQDAIMFGRQKVTSAWHVHSPLRVPKATGFATKHRDAGGWPGLCLEDGAAGSAVDAQS